MAMTIQETQQEITETSKTTDILCDWQELGFSFNNVECTENGGFTERKRNRLNLNFFTKK